MIPKIVHYCWFGNNQKNYMAKKCVKSFSKLKKNITIKEWNENNSDLSFPKFVAQANKKKIWAFISDYIRLKVLYEFGGIYLDTDVEIKKEFADSFFEADLVLGYMYDATISTAVIMSKPKHPFIKAILEHYETIELNINEPNNTLLTQKLLEFYPYFILNGKKQEFDNNCFIFPKTYFEEPVLFKSSDGYSVHHFMGSWHKNNKTLKAQLRPIIKYILFYCPLANWGYQKINRRIYLKYSAHYMRYKNDKTLG